MYKGADYNHEQLCLAAKKGLASYSCYYRLAGRLVKTGCLLLEERFNQRQIAMDNRPDCVREACNINKSFAIAHGHE